MLLLTTLVGIAFILSTAAALPTPFQVEASKGLCISPETLALLLAEQTSPGANHSKPSHHSKGSKQGGGSAANPKAIYFLSNAPNNEVIALKVADDGTLSNGSSTPTGGAGITGVDAAGAPAVPDALFSQGSVRVSGNSLFAVNAGSNTLSMFNIDSNDRTKLTMVGAPADTLGEFPMSVAVSQTLNIACVANSGAKAGIACFSIDTSKGLTPLDAALRPIDLGQSTPPVGPTNTISHTFFNADSTALLTTVKGDPPKNNTGFLSIFAVSNGTLSTQETRSSPLGTAVLFGTALIPNSKDIFVTDASFGSATLSIADDNTSTIKTSTNIPGQAATCWAAFSDLTNTAFVTDVAVNHLVEVDTQTGAIVSTFNSTNGNPGMIDLVAAGNFVYALSPGNNSTKPAVAVFDVSGGRGCKCHQASIPFAETF
jgi:hypothetical protein